MINPFKAIIDFNDLVKDSIQKLDKIDKELKLLHAFLLEKGLVVEFIQWKKK